MKTDGTSMFIDVEARIKKSNKILFSKESSVLKGLLSEIGESSRKTIVQWALDCAEETAVMIEKAHSDETRPAKAIEACRKRALGEIKMPEARKFILDAHSAAKDTDDEYIKALCHAVAQACSTVHTPKHTPAFVFYELTAIVVHNKYHDYEKAVMDKIRWYSSRLGDLQG